MAETHVNTPQPLKVVSHVERSRQRQEKLDICANILIPHIEGILDEAFTKNSHRGHIFHICSFQSQIKKGLPDYNLDRDGALDIINKYYKEGFYVQISDCNKGHKACCEKSNCIGHIEISLTKS